MVQAAGGIPWRRTPAGVEVLLVHRSRYRDWSLPKGKLDPGETHEVAAVREVREETGVLCELGEELSSLTYEFTKVSKKTGGSRLVHKSVRYWAMTPVDPDQALESDDPAEITEAAWVGLEEAATRLTHAGDRGVLSELVELIQSQR